ncbi:hypothetical protein, variant 2 [Cryptococcus amylolentus CBS 6039]|uniref:Phosphoglycerate mutase n=1 Tax=Cryptococcus amylolentus CBS 6039 TaxID=1295533 RepID=A0A1E3I711_9TREE|nr:hypothetical protein, variant 2 [Cryptococcus amylolentus CBS 6039]ODN84394.1 hypothetical protein, variant 2 [Cryptococcus amylolentus CBS 6039]
MTYTYTHLDEFFKLSTWDRDIKGSFGLQPPPGNWEGFRKRIAELQGQCAEDESIKVIFAARHGQAEHNVIKDNYRVPQDLILSARHLFQKGKWATAHVLYPILDPDLTPLGREQAAALGHALRREAGRGMPLPERYFNLREHLHVHLCDKRSKRSELEKEFPTFTYEPSMTEEDELWEPLEVRGRESDDDLVARLGVGVRQALDASEGATYLSITSHSEAIRGVYKALGVPPRDLVVGQMNIIVLRIKKVAE